MGLIERQVITTWFTPEEKHPEEDIMVVATITGKAGNLEFKNAIAIMAWCEDEGWYSSEYDFQYLIVHAWADLKPYKG